MQKDWKRFLTLLASLTLLAALALPTYAATVYTDGSLNYIIEDGGITITEYFGREAEVTVPDSIAGYPVSAIAAGAFGSGTAAIKVILPDTIMTIAEGAMAQGVKVEWSGKPEAITPPAEEPTPPSPDTTPGEAELPHEGEKPGQTETPSPTEKPDQTEKSGETSGATPAPDFTVEEVEVNMEPTAGTQPPSAPNLSVNAQGNLVSTDDKGNTTVPDDSRTYTQKENTDGTMEILDAAGNPVTEAPDKAAPAEAAPQADSAKPFPVIAVVIVAGIAALAAAALWLAKRRR